MVTLSQLGDRVDLVAERLTRLEEQVRARNEHYDLKFEGITLRFTNVWRAGIGVALVELAIVAWAASQGFDLQSLASAVG